MKYIIKDENQEVMRIVFRKEEAQYIVACRKGWSFKCIRNKQIDLSQFEEALI